jgi:hypothetical protein
VVIGNGAVNNTVQDNDEYVKFLHAEHLIPEDSNPRSQGASCYAHQCNFKMYLVLFFYPTPLKINAFCWVLSGMAEVEMVKHLGYTPNYYDYRTERIECSACYSYNYTAWALWFLQDEVEDALGICGDAG